MLTGAEGKAEWYDQYVDQDMSRDTNPLSLEQMRNALTYLDTQNNLRKANGQSALSVSLRMTAAAALNTSYSSNIWGHSNCYWDNGENLAGGGGAYTGGETEDTLGWPYTGLYTQEKEAFDKYAKKNGDLENHRYDSYYISQHYTSISQECGHYLNIIDAGTKAIGIATGSGKNTDSEVTIFDYSSFDSQADFTVSEFKKLLNDYIASAYNAGGTQEQKEQLKQLQNKLAEAQKNYGSTSNAYYAAVNKKDSARDAYTAADTNVNTAKGEYEKAKSGTAAAKTAYDAAEAKLKGVDVKTPQTKLDAAKSEAATAQAALDRANATLADSKTKAAEAAAHKAKARSARDAAKVKSDQANEAYDNATASVKDLAAKCDAAKTDLANKQGTLNDAKKADDTAQAGVDKAQAADVHAATALSDAKQAVAAKTQALSDAQAKVKAAVDAAAGLKAALSDADAKLSDANDAYAAALAELGDAKDALAAAQAEYDKYHPKAEPQAKPQVAQAAAKAPVAKKQAAPAALAQTGDDSALAGEVFVIGGITLVAAGVTLGDRRRKHM